MEKKMRPKTSLRTMAASGAVLFILTQANIAGAIDFSGFKKQFTKTFSASSEAKFNAYPATAPLLSTPKETNISTGGLNRISSQLKAPAVILKPEIVSVNSPSIAPPAPIPSFNKQASGGSSSQTIPSTGLKISDLKAFLFPSFSSSKSNIDTKVLGTNVDITVNTKQGNISSHSEIHMEAGSYMSEVKSPGGLIYDSVISTPGGVEPAPPGGSLYSQVEVNGENHKYLSSYVKHLEVSTHVSSGEVDYKESYSPAVYYLLKDNEGEVEIDERAMALADGDGKEFIHPIEEAPPFSDLDEANVYTHNQMSYRSDEEVYGVDAERGEDAWANPEEALSYKEEDFGGDGVIEEDERGCFGDCEEHAFVLASYGRFHLAEPLSENEIYAGLCTFKHEGQTVGHIDVLKSDETETAIYEPTGGWKRYNLFPEEQYHSFFNDKKVILVN